MDVREKLVELSDVQVLQREMECVKRKSATNCTDCLNCDLLMTDERILTAYKNAIDALQNARGVTVQECARPLEEWGEDYGDVLWWEFPVVEPPYVGSPLDCEWPGYHTHWTPIYVPQPPKGE